MAKQLVIYGSRDFGRVLQALAGAIGETVLGFVDDMSKGPHIMGPFDMIAPALNPADVEFVIGVGYKNLSARWQIYRRVCSAGFAVASLVHPRAIVSEQAQIGDGTILMAGSIVDTRASTGSIAVLWPGAVLSHDSTLGANSFVSPNATICGCTTLGRDCFIGAGAVVADHCRVPDGTFIKAGSVYAASRQLDSHGETA